MSTVRVVIVEDSPTQRALLVELLVRGGIEVVGQAASVDEAVATVARLAPDVVTMDLEIPGGPPRVPGGLVAIEHIATVSRVPILVLSAHTRDRTSTLAIEALAAGAADVFPKPPAWDAPTADALCRRIGVLSRLTIVTRRPRPTPRPARRGGGRPLVALVASTGGPAALRIVLGGLAGLPAPVLVVQHIHPEFVASFARWLQDTTPLSAVVAGDGQEPRSGYVYVAPADTHLRLTAGRKLALDREPDLLSRPSGDELLYSLAEHAGASTVAAVLTGMGDDGARGLLAVREAGGRTYAQDAASSVVDGMPRAARENGAAQHALPIDRLAQALREAVRAGASR